MVDVVLLLDAAQDGDGVLDAGLVNQDGLEPALEGRVLLDVLAVLVEGGRPDGMELAAREGGLDHVARVEAALARTSAHDGVQLVDEEDDAALGLLDFAQHSLEAVLELAAVLGSGDHGAQVECHDLLIAQAAGDVARHDALGEALDDGRLAGAGLADEHGVVLGAAAEHLHGAAYLVVAADDRVELALAGLLGEVLPVLLEALELRLGIALGDAGVAAQLLVHLGDPRLCHAGVCEDLARSALVLGKGHEQVLCGDVGVAHLACHLQGVVCHGGQAAAHLAHAGPAVGDLGGALDLFGDCPVEGGGVCAHALDDGGDVVLVGIQQGLEQVLALDCGRLGVCSDGHGGLQALGCGNRHLVHTHDDYLPFRFGRRLRPRVDLPLLLGLCEAATSGRGGTAFP